MMSVGIVVIVGGVLMVLVGVVMSWAEFRQRRTLGVTGFVQALAELVRALASQPTSTVLFTFGTLLIVLGGGIAGVGSLT